jgi:hypothetical protein
MQTVCLHKFNHGTSTATGAVTSNPTFGKHLFLPVRAHASKMVAGGCAPQSQFIGLFENSVPVNKSMAFVHYATTNGCNVTQDACHRCYGQFELFTNTKQWINYISSVKACRIPLLGRETFLARVGVGSLARLLHVDARRKQSQKIFLPSCSKKINIL